MKMVVAILLVSSMRAEGVQAPPELVANVSMLVATHFKVDCLQIFRTEELPLWRVEEIHRTWKKLAVTESRITTGVQTFQKYMNRKTVSRRKVSCYRSLKIMSDDEESKRGYAKFSMKFSLKDAIWLMFTDAFSVSFFQEANVVFDDVIIIAVVGSEEAVLLHEVYRVREGFPLKVLALGNWTREKGLQVSEEAMYDRRSDLEGVAVRSASVQNWPSSYLKDGKWRGFLIDLWKEIQDVINCTSVEVKGENMMGVKLENGSWNGLIGMASRDEIDVIVSEVIIDKERSHVLDFFHPIMKSRFQIYTRHMGYSLQWSSVLKPFHVSVWSAAVAWIIVATFFWAFMHRVCVCHALGSMDFERSTLVQSFFFVMQALCQQGYHHTPNSYACRVFFFVSYAVSSVLIPSYSASLVSSLAQKIHLKTFDSLQEMVAEGTYRLLVKENTASYAYFANSKDTLHKQAFEKLMKPVPEHLKSLGVRDSVRALCAYDDLAVMGVEDVIEGRLHHLVKLDCPVVPLTNPLSIIYITMAASKNNPYWGLINYHLGKLLNAGIAERLKRSEFPLGQNFDYLMKHSEGEVGVREVISGFVFIAGFTMLSAFLLLFEIQYVCYKTRKDKLKRKKRNIRWGYSKKPVQFEVKAKILQLS